MADTDTPVDATEEAAQPLPLRLVKMPGGVPNLDEALDELVARHPEDYVRLRICFQLFDKDKMSYPAMKHNAWRLEFQQPNELSRFRDELDLFIRGYVERRQRAVAGTD